MDMFEARLNLGSNHKILFYMQDPRFHRTVAITQLDGPSGPQTLALDKTAALVVVAWLKEQFQLEV